MKSLSKRILILITAGGTGGHVMPGLAVAQTLRTHGVDLMWVGSCHGLENELVPAMGIRLETLSIRGYRGKHWMTLLTLPFVFIKAVLKAVFLLKKCRPSLVLGMGGFASLPASCAAVILNIPLIIHEQNALMGLANRLLKRFGRRVLLGLPSKDKGIQKGEYVGNPVRADLFNMPPPQQRLQSRQNELMHVLVIGGSQGCATFNKLMPLALCEIPIAQRPLVKQQTGKNKRQATEQAFAEKEVHAELFEFSDNMAELYAWADLVLCRAGALSVAEVASTGVAAIFVPYPASVDDHQTVNASLLKDVGAACLVHEKDLSAGYLANLFKHFANARQELIDMGRKAHALSKRDATNHIAQICLEEARA